MTTSRGRVPNEAIRHSVHRRSARVGNDAPGRQPGPAGRATCHRAQTPGVQWGVMLHTPTDVAFLRTILDAPDDDAPRLVYADWLDEQGEADRAEFIRLQVREARMAADDPERPGVHARAEYLKQTHHVKWASRLPQFEGVHWEVPERGFFKAARFDHPDRFFAHVADVFAAAPVQELRLHQFNNTHGPRLANVVQLRSVRGLDLSAGNKLANLGTEALMASRHLGRLAFLDLSRNGLGSAGVRAIAMSSYARSIERLDLHHNDLYDDGLRHIAESRALTHLRYLDLDRSRTGDDAVRALAATKLVKDLWQLNLSNNQLSDAAVIALAGSEAVGQLRGLLLHGNGITCRGATALAGSPHLANLKYLHLRQNRIRDDGALALARSPFLEHIRELHLVDNPISDQAGDAVRARFRSRIIL
jgi:uncharacterized protein (TIGR02996 family)